MIKEGVIISERYEVMGRIGTGGMADVYKGRDHKLNRYVAVKVLKPEFRQDEMFVKKFQSEAEAAAGLLHPNVVNVYDVGEDCGLYYIVMELVEGITLKDYIQKKVRLTPKEVISITIQVCAGIGAAHKRHIIHRDIKPQNIIISKEGKVKVTDFGIAKATSSNTISTNAMGSVHYTSPEQARGGFSDEKSDVYSLGITMYEMITGRLPFDGDTTVVIALKHLQEDIIPPSEYAPDIPYSLERIILKCTQKSPERRYADMTQLSLDLRRSLRDPDGDFVVISPLRTSSNTVIMTPDELERIQRRSRYGTDDEYDDAQEELEDDEEEKKIVRIHDVKKKQDEVNPNMTKIMRVLTIVASVICVFIFIFIVGKATGILKFGPGTQQTTEGQTKVPKLLGLTEEEGKAECEKAGLEMKVVSQETSAEYDKGYICGQKTQAGTKIPKGAIIQVVVSTGLKGDDIEIPEVKNMSEEKAKAALTEKGFTGKIDVIYRADEEIETGKVIGTTPEAGEKVAQDTAITIVVSQGSEKAIMPKLVGKTQEEAQAALESVGLKGNVTEEYSSSPKGEVISQAVNSGEKLDKGTTVNYKVSKGEKPKTVQIPTNLSGKTLKEVENVLESLKLQVEEKPQESFEYGKGVVIGVHDPGATVEEGTTVTVYVSIGPGPSQEPTPEDGRE